jgi:subtilisin family serine protease
MGKVQKTFSQIKPNNLNPTKTKVMSKNIFKSFSKKALLAATISVSVMAASCSKEEAVVKTHGTEMPDQKFVQNQYIVYLDNDGLSKEQIREEVARIFTDLGITGERFAEEDILSNIGATFIANLNPAEAKSLRGDTRIRSVQQDALVAAEKLNSMPSDGARAQTVSWGVTKVGGPGNGVGKTAWIIDSGIDFDHKDLNVDKTRSKSFLTSSAGGNWSSAADEYGHGTQVAGIIAAKDNNEGAVGVAAGATVVSLRIMNYAGVCWSSGLIKALDHVYANGKPGDVVNLSVTFAANSTIDYYVKKVASRGIFVAIAAGNDNGDAVYKSPAAANGTNIYTVSGINSDVSRWSNSNYGATTVDFAAPCNGLYTTAKGGGYVTTGGGTSYAAPHVAGILLLNGGKINSSGTVANDPDGKADPIAER